MKAVELDGREVVVCNCAGVFYAIDRRCGHMNAPLEMGTLEGTILTAPCNARSSTSRRARRSRSRSPLNWGETPPPRTAAFIRNVAALMRHIRTENLRSYAAKVEGEWVRIATAP